MGRHLRLTFERAQLRAEKLAVAICIGAGLALHYTAATMGSQMPESADEIAVAGGLAGRPLAMAQAVSQDLLVPAAAEIVLEGHILPDAMVDEEPFGEFAGFLSPVVPAPVLEVTAVTRRERPIYHAINGLGRETVMLRKYALEASLLQAAVPAVVDAEMTAGGLHGFHAVVQIRKASSQHDGLQRNAMMAAFGAQLDQVIMVDDDIRDPADVEYALATRFEALRDLVVVPGARGHEYVRAGQDGIRAKLGIDATVPFAERVRPLRVHARHGAGERVRHRWRGAGGAAGVTPEQRVFIAGAGPIGLVAAACLVRQGVPVTVFEGASALATQSRASTFHPPTLDMLDDFGLAEPPIAEGAIANLTRHPYRLQAEQSRLSRIIAGTLAGHSLFELEFDRQISAVEQDDDGITIGLAGPAGLERRRGRWLIGADGARSEVRRSLGVAFDGFTWPERFLVVTTSFAVEAVIPHLVPVTYVADPQQWHFLLQIPGAWRVMFPVPAETSDADAAGREYAATLMVGVVPGIERYDVAHTTLYRMHQRVATTYRVGRAFLAGDAAHINNPLGGMGMNGGIHDAVNLAGRLADAWHRREAELDRYDAQRRRVTLEHVQTATIKNKNDLEAKTEADCPQFHDETRSTAADPALTRALLRRVSMIASLSCAAELG